MAEKVTPAVLDKNREVKEKEVPMIAMRQTFVDSEGNVEEKWRGPMPVSEWAEYEKENKL